MKVNCPICNRTGDYNPSEQGSMIPCTHCGNLFVLKDKVLPALCPECDNNVEPDVRICLECGYNFDSGRKVGKHIPVYGEDFTPQKKMIDAVVDFIPGLFRPLVFLAFCTSVLIALFIIWMGLFILSLGALATCIYFSICALIVYAHGVGFLLSGEVSMLRNALVEIDGAKWTFFFIMVFGPPVTVWLILFIIAKKIYG